MFNVLKSLAIGDIVLKQLSINSILVWKEPVFYKNWVKYAIDTDGSLYNGCGYMDNYRLNSSAIVKEASGATHTGYISVTSNDMVKAIVGTAVESNSANYVAFYDSDFKLIFIHTYTNAVAYGYASYVTQDDGRYLLTIDLSHSKVVGAAYIRVSCGSCKGADMIVAMNEEIS